jgi:hypothetical protein
MSEEVVKPYEPKRNFQKKVTYKDFSNSSDEEAEIGLTEWVRNKKTRSCSFDKKEPKRLSLDVTKVDKIFDLLLQQG